MLAHIYNSKIHDTEIVLPPSKSMAHRAIICASLANGRSIISNIAYSEDIKSTIEAMRILGSKIDCFDDYIVVQGINDFKHLLSNEVMCNESGSTIRFLIPLFSLCNQQIIFKGTKRLLERPQTVYEQLFNNWHLKFNHTSEYIEINESIKGGYIELDGNISSQFITGLLFALPFLDCDSIIKIKPPFESKSYIDLTIAMLKEFNIEVLFIDDNTLSIKGKQQYISKNIKVEGDFSQLGFFSVLGTINGNIKTKGLLHDSLQGDKAILDIINSFNGKYDLIEDGYKFYKQNTIATCVDLQDCPDLGPILMVLAALSEGTSKIINAGRLRIKESDRIQAMEDELKKIGVDITSTYDVVTICGKSTYQGGIKVLGHNDHRIVMALSIMATILEDGLIIDDALSINKSYPNFFEDLKKLGVKVELYAG